MKTITRFEIKEAASVCGIKQSEIMQFIQESWIEPFDKANLFLDEEDIERIKFITELQDMGVNDEAVPIILHLIDQLNLLQHTLHERTYVH